MRLKFFLLIFLLTACGSDDKPENLIPEDKMAKALAEIHILESQINNFHFQNEDSSVYVYQKMKVKILRTLDLDTVNFRSSLKYYLLNPDKMKGIYAEVKKNLEAKKKIIEKLDKLKKKQQEALKAKEKQIDYKVKPDSSIKTKLIKSNLINIIKKAKVK